MYGGGDKGERYSLSWGDDRIAIVKTGMIDCVYQPGKSGEGSRLVLEKVEGMVVEWHAHWGPPPHYQSNL
jgi:hypothetical protein